MRKAATLGFAVAKPWGDSERYDAVIRAGRIFWRVQIKSAFSAAPSRGHYRIKTASRAGIPYTKDEIDFLVAYLFAKDTWYVFPVAVVENYKSVCVMPGSKKSRFERYREAWNLMEQTSAEPVPVPPGPLVDIQAAAAT
jgi:PD-(D/E)XK endonuclease